MPVFKVGRLKNKTQAQSFRIRMKLMLKASEWHMTNANTTRCVTSVSYF